MLRLCSCLIATWIALALVAPAQAAVPRGWAPTANMSQARAWSGVVTLDNGKVLVAGGEIPGSALAGTELYDPATGTWSPAAPMTEPRSTFVMVKLRNGKVLAAGGYNGTETLATAELYDPATNAWTRTGDMKLARFRAATAVLASGEVLVAGGSAPSGVTNTAETYNPANGVWTRTANDFAQPAVDVQATTLADGRVLIAGGNTPNEQTTRAALYEPVPRTFTTVAPMNAGRSFFGLSTLANGRALAAGGPTAEVYDPQANVWTATLPAAAAHQTVVTTRMTNGAVLVSGGGGTTTEAYFSEANSWAITGNLNTARYFHAATLLADGRVLVAGGYTGPAAPTATAEVWTPTTALTTDPAYAFGDQVTGRATSAVVQVINTGDQPLFAADFALGGANPGDFTVNGDRCRGPVAPNATCLLDVRFAPTAGGTRSATLAFSANTAAGTHAIPLSGHATADADGDGVQDASDRCRTLKGTASRQGCPKGLLADPSIRYRPSGMGIRVIAYYVKATTGARVTVKCSKGCKRTITTGKGAKRVRITRLNGKRLTNGTRITITVSRKNRLTTTVVDRVSRGRRIEGRPRCTPVGC